MKRKSLILMIGVLAAVIGGCTLKPETPLPPPDHACPTRADWKGIVPGQSTEADVVKVLNQPESKETVTYEDKTFMVYSYKTDSGLMNDWLKLKNKIYFGPTGVVRWMEIFLSPPGENPKDLKFFSDQLGRQFDLVYTNNNNFPSPPGMVGDILAGPDTVFVWSNCGVALLGLNGCDVAQGGKVECGAAKSGPNPREDYTVLHRSPSDEDFPISPNAGGYVYLQYLFPSTTYEGFQKNFRYKIPFYYNDFWNKFKDFLVLPK